MHFPVTSSHRRRPHSHAADGREDAFGETSTTNRRGRNAGGAWLTSAVGEAVVSRSTLGTLAPDDVLSAGALSPGWIAARPLGPGSVAVAGQSAVVVGRGERAGGPSAERRCRFGAEEK